MAYDKVVDSAVLDSKFTAIANAIRAKNETTDTYTPDEMPQAIADISSGKSSIIVTAPTGSTVTCSSGNVTKTASEENGTWTFKECDIGTWTINASLDTSSATKTVVIQESGQLMRYEVSIAYRLYASDFDWDSYGTLGTDYEIVYDDDTDIPQEQWTTTENWKARLLTSNGLIPLSNGKIDVFLVGGGAGPGKSSTYSTAGAGGSGYTTTNKNVELTANETYEVTVGSGGAYGADGGATTAFGETADGGKKGNDGSDYNVSGKKQGGDGGSGGGAGGGKTGNGSTDTATGGAGGIDGDDGKPNSDGVPGGTGQGTTTREFGEEDGRLYATGGSGVGVNNVTPPEANTGDGGKSGSNNTGASGIVVIRNAREVAA